LNSLKGIQAVILIKKKCFPIKDLNFDLDNHKDILQLKFYSFGKVFAHVRNCLLMKKMSDVQKLNRGRTKTLMDST